MMRKRATVARFLTAAVFGLTMFACADDGPPVIVVDSAWSAQRAQLRNEFVLSNWSLDSFTATDMAFLPDGRALLTTKGGWGGRSIGQVVLIAADGSTSKPILDVPVCTDGERGLLGIAIDPTFEDNQRFYIFFTKAVGECATTDPNDQGLEHVTSRLSSFEFNELGVDVASEVVHLDNIFAGRTSHHAGGLSFMPDQTLLVGVGEGTLKRSHDLDLANGKILRLDVSRPGWGAGDNPFFDPENPTAVRSLVFASGLRNPFRVAADPETSRIAVGDVGTEVYEEVNLISPGSDYGFPEVEGPDPTDVGVSPAVWYTHENGCNSIIGGTWVPSDWAAPRDPPGFAFTDFGCRSVYVAYFHGEQLAKLTQIPVEIETAVARVILGPDNALYLVSVGNGDVPVQRLELMPL